MRTYLLQLIETDQTIEVCGTIRAGLERFGWENIEDIPNGKCHYYNCTH